MDMSHMLAFTIQPSIFPGKDSNPPFLVVGAGRDATQMAPAQAQRQDDSYWICIINANNPREKVKDWVIPGTQNSTVPAGIDTYMNNPGYIFVVATEYLNTLHVPQGAFYDFLVKYGAGRELQKLEQLNAVLSCGNYGHMSYVLIGQCGPREAGKPAPISYEKGSYLGDVSALMMMSLMPQKNGAPPYSICDSYSWKNPPAAS
jgi:hypothetical protein